MAANARIVLADCGEAHGELVDGLVGSLWRRRWATVVVLLRTTLHVLDKVDGASNPAMRRAVDDAWEEVKPDIFTAFIESGRNLLLKEYSFLAGQNATVYVGEGRSDITYSVNDGLYAGEDPRAVARQAIEWLDQYLTDIDRAAGLGSLL